MLSPEGRVVMVSGANRGIGLAVATALHARGYTLSLGARDAGKLDAATSPLGRDRVMTASFDARDTPVLRCPGAPRLASFGLAWPNDPECRPNSGVRQTAELGSHRDERTRP